METFRRYVRTGVGLVVCGYSWILELNGLTHVTTHHSLVIFSPSQEDSIDSAFTGVISSSRVEEDFCHGVESMIWCYLCLRDTI